MKNLILLLVVAIAAIGHNPFAEQHETQPVYKPQVSDKPPRAHTASAADTPAALVPATPAVTIPQVARLAFYPLLAGPDLIGTEPVQRASIAATLSRANHALSTAFGDAETMTLLDRDAQTHPLASNASSPERAALSGSLPADYVLGGTLETKHAGLQMRLQLSHVQTTRLIATMNVPLTPDMTLRAAPVVARFAAAIDDHRKRVRTASDNDGFRLSVAAFLPSRNDRSGNRASLTVRQGITDILLNSNRHRVMAGDYAMALSLEARLARHESSLLKPDVIVHGRLIAVDPEQNGFNLVLYIERIKGLRTTVTLHAESLSSLINQATSAIHRRLAGQPPPADATARAESARLLKQAWLEIFSSDSPRTPIASFPQRVSDRNRAQLNRMMALTRRAIDQDAQNFQAAGALALASAATGDRATEVQLLEQLMWDRRRPAFDHGTAIMLRRFHRGTYFYIAGEVDGLPGISEPFAINQLLASGVLVPRNGSGDSPRYHWASTERLRYEHDEQAIGQYIAGNRVSAIDDWARFKLSTSQGPIPTAHPNRDDGVTGTLEASHYYSLANASAPIMLNLGNSGFYSAPVDVEITLPDGKPLPAAQVSRYLNLIGKSMLADGNHIEADLLYATMICEYDASQCRYSQLIYQDIDNNADNIRRRIVGDKDRRGRKRLVADGLIEMAQRELQTRSYTAAPRPIAKTTTQIRRANTNTAIPAASADAPQLHDCTDCPDYIKAGMISSPNGQWQLARKPDFDGATPIRPEFLPPGLRDQQSYSRAREWLFANELIDLQGMPTQYRIPTETARRDLPQLFPGIGEPGIRQFSRGYRKSRNRPNSGRITLYHSASQTTQLLHAPDGFAEQEFGSHASISNNRLLVCDAHRNAYVYKLEVDQWHFDRKVDQICVTQNLRSESPVVINDKWLVSYRLDGRISFFKDDGVEYRYTHTRQINEDFPPAHRRGSAIEGIWLGEQTLLVGTRSRAGYRLLSYTLHENDWTASSSFDSESYFTAIRFNKNRAWQLSGEHIIAYRLDDGIANYDFQVSIPDAKAHIGNRSSVLFVRQNDSTNLVWASAGIARSMAVP